MNTITATLCVNNHVLWDALMCGFFRSSELRIKKSAAYAVYDMSCQSPGHLLLFREPMMSGNTGETKNRADVFPVAVELTFPVEQYRVDSFDESGRPCSHPPPDDWRILVVSSFLPVNYIRQMRFRSEDERESFLTSKTANTPLPPSEQCMLWHPCVIANQKHEELVRAVLKQVDGDKLLCTPETNALINRTGGALVKAISYAQREPATYSPAEVLWGLAPVFCRDNDFGAVFETSRMNYVRAERRIQMPTITRAPFLLWSLRNLQERSPFELLEGMSKLEQGVGRTTTDALDSLCWLATLKVAMEVPESNADREILFTALANELRALDKTFGWKKKLLADGHNVEAFVQAFALCQKVLASEEGREAISRIPENFRALRAWLLYSLEGDLDRLDLASAGNPAAPVNHNEMLDAAMLGAVRQGYHSLSSEEKQSAIVQAVIEQLCICETGLQEEHLKELTLNVTDETTDFKTGVQCRVLVKGPWSQLWELAYDDYLEDCATALEGRVSLPDEVAVELARFLGWDHVIITDIEFKSEVSELKVNWARRVIVAKGEPVIRTRVDNGEFNTQLHKSAGQVNWREVPLCIKRAILGQSSLPKVGIAVVVKAGRNRQDKPVGARLPTATKGDGAAAERGSLTLRSDLPPEKSRRKKKQ